MEISGLLAHVSLRVRRLLGPQDGASAALVV
jgi:hypothetical protein